MTTAAATLEDRCASVVRRFRSRPDASARTLLVTVFGDSIVAHQTEVWIGSLVRLVEPFGINEKLARTSLNRLVGEGLLAARREGRRSFYSVTPAASAEFHQAERRIYQPRGEPWDGRWSVVVETNGLAPSVRTAFRHHLGRLGFGTLGPSVHLCPEDRTAELRSVVADLGLERSVTVFRGEVPAGLGLGDGDLVPALPGDLEALEPPWRDFLRRFGPLAEAAGVGGRVDGEAAFLARTLLVHAYRRVVLREPKLPAGLWPPGWIGEAAYGVAARGYHALTPGAEAHLASTCETGGGRLPPLGADYTGRFPLPSPPIPSPPIPLPQSYSSR